MAMTDATHKIKIIVDSSDAKRGVTEVSNSLTIIVETAKNAGSSIEKMGRQMRAANDNAKTFKTRLNELVEKLKASKVAAGLFGAAVATAMGLALKAFMQLSDAWNGMIAKLRVATTSAADFAKAQADVVAIAQRTRSGITDIGELYTKIAKNAKNLGVDTRGAGVATETFAKMLKIGGASAQEASSSILQLGQAMGSGVLAGDEFKSLAENSQIFTQTLANSMGVPLGSLKKLAAEGKITGAEIAKALTDPKIVEDINRQFGLIPTSFGDVMTATKNMATMSAGTLFSAMGLENILGNIYTKINAFANNAQPTITKIGKAIGTVFSTIGPIVSGAFGVLNAVLSPIINNLDSIAKASVAVATGFATIKAIQAFNSIPAALTAVVGGLGKARLAMNAFTASMLANPLTAIAAAITVTLTLLYQFRDSIKLTKDGVGTLGDLFRVVFDDAKAVFSTVVNAIRSGMSAIGNFVNKHLKGVADFFKNTFGGVEFSVAGFVRFAATAFDLFVGDVRAKLFAVTEGFKVAFQGIGFIVSSVMNGTLTVIEFMINKTIAGLRSIVDFANKIPGVNLDRPQDVRLGRVTQIAAPDVQAYRDGITDRRFGTRIARDPAESLLSRAEERGRNRVAEAGREANPAADAATDTTNAIAEAAKAGKEAADKVGDFWKGLEQAKVQAGLTGFELEKHVKTLELQEALGRDINALEGERLEKLLRQTATAKTLTELTEGIRDATHEKTLAERRSQLLGSMSVDAANREFDIEKKLADFKYDALKTGANLEDEALKTALAQYELVLRENAARSETNKLLEEKARLGEDLIKRYAREADPRAAALTDFNERNAAIGSAQKPEGTSQADWQRMVAVALKGSADEYNKTLTDIAQKWRGEMLSAVDQIADAIGGKTGDIISQLGKLWDAMARSAEGDHSGGGLFGGLSKLLGGAQGNRNGFGSAYDAAAKGFSPEAMAQAFSKPMESLSEGFASFKSMFAEGGSFTKGLGSAMGKMGQGGMIGGIVGGIGSMISDKFSQGGANIGGMIGGLFGPIGSVLGSIGGGLLGGLFGGKKVARGSASFSLDEATGQLEVSSSGKHGGEGDAAKLANAVVSGITGIASKLGATLTSNFDLAVGKNGGDWRVNTSGGGVTGKQGTTFKTMEEALAFALKDLINDGILDGISSFSQRFLKNAKNLDAAVALAESYEKLLKNLAAMNDPVGSSIKELTDGLDRMTKQMKAAGATTDELAKVEEYRSKKLSEMLKEATSGFVSFRKDLFGEGSGVSAMNRLVSAQGEFAKLHQTILSGGTVDQDEFTAVGQNLMDLARSVYGQSSSQFQAIREMLIGATDGAIENVTKYYENATVTAINTVAEQQAISNDYLRQIAESLAKNGGNAGGGYSGGGMYAANGYVQTHLV